MVKFLEISVIIFIISTASGKNLQQNGKEKIVGGIEAIPNSLPYQVIMLVQNEQRVKYYFGGSLISANYVLTTASSFYDVGLPEVMLAAHNISEVSEHQVNVMAEAVILHELWDPIELVNDIALIKLSTPVGFNEFIQPVKLPRYSDSSNSYEGEIAKISGWGKPEQDEPYLSDVLRYVDVPVMNHAECIDIYLGYVIDTNICTVGDGGKGFCSGDNGGPLVLDNVQIGIVSFIYWNGCGSGIPAVYTRTTSYLDWIAANTDVVIEA